MRRELCLLMMAWMLPCFVLAIKFSPHFMEQIVEVNFTDQSFCKVDCKVGTPCEYKDEVDFRIIVMTYNREHSLKNCLEAISHVDTMDMRVSVDIWIDRKQGEDALIDQNTLLNAVEFQLSWKGGRVCIHQRETNAYIDGQWIDTWRPKLGTKEISLILEDDIDISNHTLRWLREVHAHYDHMTDIGGYTLQMEGTRFFRGGKGALRGPKTDNVFLYSVLGTWGFSPHAQRWRDFQDWFHTKNNSVKPYVPDIVPTKWYQSFERGGSQRSMWEMWHIYFSYINKLYTVYCNLHFKYARNDVLLSFNRKEKGLHFTGNNQVSEINWKVLLAKWQSDYAIFPKSEVRYTYEGNVVP